MDEKSKKALKRAVALAGGQAQLARLIGGTCKQAHIWNWLNRDTRIPAEYAVQIEEATMGRVTREELRPDLYRKTKFQEARA